MLLDVNDLPKLNHVTPNRFKKLKEKILALHYLLSQNDGLDQHEREELVSSIMEDGLDKQSSTAAGAWAINKAKKFFGSLIGADSSPTRVADVPRVIFEVHDRVFLSRLGQITDTWPILAEVATRAAESARDHFQDTVKKEAKTLQARIASIQRNQCQEWIKRKADGEQKSKLEQLRVTLLKALKFSGPTVATDRCVNQDIRVLRRRICADIAWSCRRVLTIRSLERDSYHVYYGKSI